MADAHYPAVQLGAHVLRDRQKGNTLDLHNGMSSETQRTRLPGGQDLELGGNFMSERGGGTGHEVITSMEGINSVYVTCNLGGG